VVLRYKGLAHGTLPITVRYYDGRGYDERYLTWVTMDPEMRGESFDARPPKWRKADPVLVVSLSRRITENVDWTLLYGRRVVKNILFPISEGFVDLVDQRDGELSFFERRPLHVLRSELSISF
jgi:hypothetical protein